MGIEKRCVQKPKEIFLRLNRRLVLKHVDALVMHAAHLSTAVPRAAKGVPRKLSAFSGVDQQLPMVFVLALASFWVLSVLGGGSPCKDKDYNGCPQVQPSCHFQKETVARKYNDFGLGMAACRQRYLFCCGLG